MITEIVLARRYVVYLHEMLIYTDFDLHNVGGRISGCYSSFSAPVGRPVNFFFGINGFETPAYYTVSNLQQRGRVKDLGLLPGDGRSR